MRRAVFRARNCARAALAVAFAALVAPNARADASALNAHLECARAAAPGRIVCELRAGVSSSAASGRLVWLDALVVRAPDFARPLRSRVVAQITAGASATAPSTAEAKLALVGSSPGTGALELRVRSVVCQDGANGEWCGPVVARVSSPVEVGPAPGP